MQLFDTQTTPTFFAFLSMPRQYALSFTAGGLLFYESIVVAEALLRCEFDWSAAREDVQKRNLLQSRTASTADRKLREVVARLEELTHYQIGLLVEGTPLDQKLLLWLACCRCYQFVADFAKEVVRGKYLELDISIQPVDIENYFETKMLWHEELEGLTSSTRGKLQTVLMRMLRESRLLSDEGIIQSPLMSRQLVDAIRSDSIDHFDFFPMATPE